MAPVMRWVLAALLLSAPAMAQQPPPPTIAIPAPVLLHALNYLGAGGTRAEGDALAEELRRIAKEDFAKQQAAAVPPTSEKPAP